MTRKTIEFRRYLGKFLQECGIVPEVECQPLLKPVKPASLLLRQPRTDFIRQVIENGSHRQIDKLPYQMMKFLNSRSKLCKIRLCSIYTLLEENPKLIPNDQRHCPNSFVEFVSNRAREIIQDHVVQGIVCPCVDELFKAMYVLSEFRVVNRGGAFSGFDLRLVSIPFPNPGN